MRWDVFISYSRRDKSLVHQVAADLQSLGKAVWLDEVEIRAGQNIIDEVSTGMEGSTHFVAFLSEAYLKSVFAREELTSALMDALSPVRRSIVPVRLDGAPVPMLLRARKYCDFRSGYIQGFRELAVALGVQSPITALRVWFEHVELRLESGGHAAWGYEREFELAVEQGTVRDLVIHSNSPPTNIGVSHGVARLERLPGFFAIFSEHDPPLAAGVRHHQSVHYELDGVYGDPSDFWFYTMPTSFGNCEVRIVFPPDRAPTAYEARFERDGSVTPGPPLLHKVLSDGGSVLSCSLDPYDSQYRQIQFDWRW